jgi:hypothetical protein
MENDRLHNELKGLKELMTHIYEFGYTVEIIPEYDEYSENSDYRIQFSDKVYYDFLERVTAILKKYNGFIYYITHNKITDTTNILVRFVNA